MTYYVIITAEFSQLVNGTMVYFTVNSTYPLVESYKDVLEDGVINVYNVATVNETETNLSEDYTAVISELEIPEYANEVEKFLAERTDTTDNYTQAYLDRLGIDVNPYQDVDKARYKESEKLTREDPPDDES